VVSSGQAAYVCARAESGRPIHVELTLPRELTAAAADRAARETKEALAAIAGAPWALIIDTRAVATLDPRALEILAALEAEAAGSPTLLRIARVVRDAAFAEEANAATGHLADRVCAFVELEDARAFASGGDG
jgi:hypothetical protein